MELKSLILGLVFGLGVFALKSGVGLGYLLTVVSGRRRKWLLGGAHVAAYLLLFLLCGLLLSKIALFDYFPQLQRLFAAGMTLHLISAVALGGWGLWLLLKQTGGDSAGASKGWLLLSLPCPVCSSVILLECAFMLNLYPQHSITAIGCMAAGFVLIQLLSAAVLLLRGVLHPSGHDRMLGMLMCLLAAYFLLTLCIVPQFAQIDRIYRLSAAGADTAVNAGFVKILLLMAAVVSGGYLLRWRNLKRSLA
ncbi:MAG: hypothetical protein JW773_07040 [Desulfuromonadales bacterium]|nr:hypothetical protein [Desulfuromonadales bacterium]